jgi:hypothetical protein
VEDGRLAGLEREREVPPEVDQLVLDRREDPIVVEAGLADRDDPFVGRLARETRPRCAVDLGGVVRMDADRGVEPRETLDEGERAGTRGDIPARNEDALDAGKAGAADDEVDVVLETIGVEMAM